MCPVCGAVIESLSALGERVEVKELSLLKKAGMNP